MARVPLVESPCPITGKQLPAGDTEHCSVCDRQVHNLDRLDEPARRAFMAGCGGQVCVAYSVRRIGVRTRGGPEDQAAGPRRRALGAAALAAVAIASLPAAAQESPVVGQSPGDPNALPACDEWIEIVMGGVAKGDEAKWVDDGKDAPPELPTMVDDGR